MPAFPYPVNANLGCIFELEEVSTGDCFLCHLRRFPTDPAPKLPKNILRLHTEALLGELLLKWKEDHDIQNTDARKGAVFYYRVVSRKPGPPLVASSPKSKSRTQKIETNRADPTEHASGHMAREETTWGSYPMHEPMNDEATGKERDFEDYYEYAANYSE